MIPSGVQVFVALELVDMRYGFERLSGLARERIGFDARSGALFIFVGRRRETIKILFFDGSGIFNFIEGVIDHQLLGIHHVHPGDGQLAWDLGFLAFGLVQIAIGVAAIRAGRGDTTSRGGFDREHRPSHA